ncbi:hypothetical protein DAPPUDRAFT_332841 [Daphnia pulex]|uniref:Uncharacterized protein n=1 Tax=Daphnia pulex TaxID=6669 RepID=E9HR35_DAPPU|nr:hypothetical protein DAPPUDRAFT_332841 [Daphnia pulex]|eukprot:EFX65803.1 hypothetical protein DAPPUDRAFT_332841 [Daphnia pulex]
MSDSRLLAEKVESDNPPMESVKVFPIQSTSQELTKELENLKFRYNNLKSQNAKDVCELEELSTRY